MEVESRSETDKLAIVWSEQVVRVAQLKPFERNPRRISRDLFAKLKDSLSRSGYHQRICVTANLRVWGGHQRIRALRELGIKTIPVLVPNKELTDDEFRRLLIQDNLPFGEFDFEMLANDFTVEELTDWGMPEQIIGVAANDEPAEELKDDEENSKTNECPSCGHRW